MINKDLQKYQRIKILKTYIYRLQVYGIPINWMISIIILQKLTLQNY